MIKIDGVDLKVSNFPDGTLNIKAQVPTRFVDGRYQEIEIMWKYEPNEEMTLYYLVKHIRSKNPTARLTLALPYIPNARMDRVKNPDEVFTLKYFADFINDMKFDKVYVVDAHSDVSVGLLNNVLSVKSTFHRDVVWQARPDVLFFPDNGAKKRYGDNFIAELGLPQTYGIKNRDWNNGEIKALELENSEIVKDKNVLIIDDICSFGGTFVQATKALMEAGAESVSLSVTHCEDNVLKGHLLNTNGFDTLYTTNSIFTGSHEHIIVLNKY